jgi:hypothetical protein
LAANARLLLVGEWWSESSIASRKKKQRQFRQKLYTVYKFSPWLSSCWSASDGKALAGRLCNEHHEVNAKTPGSDGQLDEIFHLQTAKRFVYN